MTQLTFEQLPGAVADINLKIDRLLQFLSDKPVEKKDEWLDIAGLIEYLPEHPAIPTIYAKVGKREIPFHKRGRKLIFLKSEIDIYLQSGRRKTIAQIKEDTDDELSASYNEKRRRKK